MGLNHKVSWVLTTKSDGVGLVLCLHFWEYKVTQNLFLGNVYVFIVGELGTLTSWRNAKFFNSQKFYAVSKLECARDPFKNKNSILKNVCSVLQR